MDRNLPPCDGLHPEEMKISFGGTLPEDHDFPPGVPKLGDLLTLESVEVQVNNVSHIEKEGEVTRVVKLKVISVGAVEGYAREAGDQ